jgi:hypothetical protein
MWKMKMKMRKIVRKTNERIDRVRELLNNSVKHQPDWKMTEKMKLGSKKKNIRFSVNVSCL